MYIAHRTYTKYAVQTVELSFEDQQTILPNLSIYLTFYKSFQIKLQKKVKHIIHNKFLILILYENFLKLYLVQIIKKIQFSFTQSLILFSYIKYTK